MVQMTMVIGMTWKKIFKFYQLTNIYSYKTSFKCLFLFHYSNSKNNNQQKKKE